MALFGVDVALRGTIRLSMTDTSSPTLTHGCVRCGRPIPLEVAMCETCNPIGLSQPSASQVHGTVVVGIILFVAFLAIVGRLAVSGIGPFDARLVDAVRSGDGLTVSIEILNSGTRAGATSCVLSDPEQPYSGPTVRLQTPVVEGGARLTFQREVAEFGAVPLILDVTCADP